jgi:hypothetical protein
MAKARKDKLHDHGVEHLQGGQNAEPNPSMPKAACTVGESTNDRIESMFGMLDRYILILLLLSMMDVISPLLILI